MYTLIQLYTYCLNSAATIIYSFYITTFLDMMEIFKNRIVKLEFSYIYEYMLDYR